MRINYLKISFKTSPPSDLFVKRYFNKNNNLRVGSFIEFKKVKITLMGAKFTFVNVTGLQSLSHAKSFKKFYLLMSGVESLSNIKIDSISATHRFPKKSEINFEDFRKKLFLLNLTVKDNSKFPGVVIRNREEVGGGCAVYFRSGSVNFVGYKHIYYIIKMKNKIEEAYFNHMA